MYKKVEHLSLNHLFTQRMNVETFQGFKMKPINT
jgi:hypothetical protein